MLFERKRNAAYTDDDPPIVLSLRYATEPPPQPWPALFTGGLLHVLTLGLLLVDSFAVPSEIPKPSRPPVTKLFIPPRPRATPEKQPPPPPEKKSPVVASAAPRPKREDPPPPEPPAVKDRVDMQSIEISVLEDAANELPEVIRRQQGILALVEPGDQSIAHYVFEPPDWKMRDRIADVSGRIRFSMSPPSRWALLRSLAERHSIDMEKYQVDALFDGAYQDCLKSEIRRSAEASPNAGRVRSAVLVFNSSRSCGIDVVKLEFSDP
jgi:hypothetical protein